MAYKVIIDADSLVYKLGFALEEVTNLKTVEHTLQSEIDTIVETVRKVFVNIDAPDIIISAPGKSNFRFEIAKTKEYKGNRIAAKPKHYDFLRTLLLAMPNSQMVSGQEADDTIADMTAINPEKTVVATVDKDLLQNPGWYFIPSGKRPIFYVDKDTVGVLLLERASGNKPCLFGTGTIWLHAQMLLGDTADNIPGIKGYGVMKVYNLLKGLTRGIDIEAAVMDAYIKAGVVDRYQEIYTLLKIGGHKL